MTTDTLEALREAREALRRIVAGPGSIAGARVIAAQALSRIDAALAPDHIGNSTTMVPTLGVEGVCENRLMAALQEADAEFGGGLSGFRYRSLARAIIAAMEKKDGATLDVAQIKATIWKHWRNQNGQTLEDRFTSAAEEIADLTPRP